MASLIQFCLTFSRAILSDTKVRRQWIFFITLLVLIWVFGGYFVAFDLLKRHQWLFIVYVLASLAGLAMVFLFAIFDLLMVRKAFQEERRAARRELTEQIQAAIQKPSASVPSAQADSAPLGEENDR